MKSFILLALLTATFAQADPTVTTTYRKATYAAVASSLTPPATPTDMCLISGSATKAIAITKLEVSGTATSSTEAVFHVVKRSTADTGGTASVLARIPYDSTLSVATVASVSAFSANPTLGTLLGTLASLHVLLATTSGTSGPAQVWYFDQNNNAGPIVLHGVNEEVALNFAGAALPTGMSINCGWTWTEE